MDAAEAGPAEEAITVAARHQAQEAGEDLDFPYAFVSEKPFRDSGEVFEVSTRFEAVYEVKPASKWEIVREGDAYCDAGETIAAPDRCSACQEFVRRYEMETGEREECYRVMIRPCIDSGPGECCAVNVSRSYDAVFRAE
jgi:hypothetical protein